MIARWRAWEPVRLYLYSVLVPVVAVLVYLGLIDTQAGVLWLAVAAAALGVPAVELARQAVTPMARAQQLEQLARIGAAKVSDSGD